MRNNERKYFSIYSFIFLVLVFKRECVFELEIYSLVIS